MSFAEKFFVIGLLLLATLVTGLWLALLGKPLNGMLGVLHKIFALILVMFLAIRISYLIRLFESGPAMRAAVVVLLLSILAAFATGIIESVPSVEGVVWLTMHRIASAMAAIAGGVTALLLMLNKR